MYARVWSVPQGATVDSGRRQAMGPSRLLSYSTYSPPFCYFALLRTGPVPLRFLFLARYPLVLSFQSAVRCR
jgi:hypothetical protein